MTNTSLRIPVIAVPVATSADRSGYLALGTVMSYAQSYQDGALQQFFDFRKVSPFPYDDAEVFLRKNFADGKAVYLFSAFVWNEKQSLDIAAHIKAKSPEAIIIFGGANIPRRADDCKTYIQNNPTIDFIVIGEGELTLAELLSEIAVGNNNFSSIAGIAFREDNAVTITSSRSTLVDLNEIPSPYLNNIYDEEFIKIISMGWMESTRGCPFNCTFCDWGGLIGTKVRKFDYDRVIHEIEWMRERNVRNISFIDANFGMLSRDIEIVDYLISLKDKYDWPSRFDAAAAKNSSERVIEISRKLYNAGLTGDRLAIALQTTDTETLNIIERSNIKLSAYEDVIASFRENSMQMFTELMLGLPGQTPEKFKVDLQKNFDWMIMPSIFLVSVMPNAKMGDPEYQKKYNIVVDNDGFIESCYSFTREELQEMILFRLYHTFFIHNDFSRYTLLFIQIEKKVNALDVLQRIFDKRDKLISQYSYLHRLCEIINKGLCTLNRDWILQKWQHEDGVFMQENFSEIYNDFFIFIENEFMINISQNEKKSLSSLQRATFIHYKRKLPDITKTPLDVVAYFNQLKQMKVLSLTNIPEDFKTLSAFHTPSEIHTPKQKTRLRMGFQQSDLRKREWCLVISGLEGFY